jgi:hypothetical protein
MALRYTTQDLLWSTTLIAAGLCLLVLLAGDYHAPDGWISFAAGSVVFLWSGGLLGAGVGAIFQRKLLGAVVGVVLFGLLGIMLVLMLRSALSGLNGI